VFDQVLAGSEALNVRRHAWVAFLFQEEQSLGTKKKSPGIDDLTEAEALAILRRLWGSGGQTRSAIRAEIDKQLSQVVPEHVTDAVLADLDGLSVQELWNRSGPSESGYTDPADETWNMLQEALEPYVRDLERYLRLDRAEEAFLHCLGILEGLYLFGRESDTEFRTWASDDPQEAFHWVLGKWVKATADDDLRTRMEQSLLDRCPEWWTRQASIGDRSN